MEGKRYHAVKFVTLTFGRQRRRPARLLGTRRDHLITARDVIAETERLCRKSPIVYPPLIHPARMYIPGSWPDLNLGACETRVLRRAGRRQHSYTSNDRIRLNRRVTRANVSTHNIAFANFNGSFTVTQQRQSQVTTPTKTAMTCVRQPHQAFPPASSPAGFNPSGFPITAGKVQDDWRTIAKEETTTEDIRFSFSIWHVPTSISEPGQRKSDTAIRGRTPSRLVRPSIPFAWLPLLPLDQSTESPQALGVVKTGISLSLPLTDEEQQVSTPTLIRRIPTAIVEVDEDALPVKKKQRLSLGTKEMEQEETMASWEDAGRVVSAQKARNLSGPVIRKVRMRDVDIVEDFLVSTRRGQA